MIIKDATQFGELVRQKRKTLGLTQEQLATRCGVGIRFIVELEAGKPTSQLGKALMAAAEVGIRLTDVPPRAQAAETDANDPLSQIPSY